MMKIELSLEVNFLTLLAILSFCLAAAAFIRSLVD